MANSVTHAALPYPVKGCRFTCPIPYLDADGDPTDPTTPDTEVSIDGAAYADCTEEATTIAGSNGSAYLTLTGDELNASLVFVAAKVGSGPKNTLLALQPRVLPVIRSGTAVDGTASTITLDADAWQQDNVCIGSIVRTTGGTGGGGGSGSRDNQARVITGYLGSTRVATVVPDWETTPDDTTTFEILATDLSGHSLAAPVHPVELASQVDVANLALAKIGDTQILTFDDDSTHARIIKLLYPRVVDSVLRGHKWRFAVRQSTLAQLTGSPTWRYSYRYQLPTDPFCLKVIRSSADDLGTGGTDAWEIQGREILTDAATLTIEYIARITDPQQWDALFLEAVTERLGAELAIPITSTVALRDGLLKTYLLKIGEAQSMDGMEATAERDTSSELADVRQ